MSPGVVGSLGRQLEGELKVGSLANKNYFKKFQEIIIFDVYASKYFFELSFDKHGSDFIKSTTKNSCKKLHVICSYVFTYMPAQSDGNCFKSGHP